jgi:aconitase A
MSSADSFGAKGTLDVNGKSYEIYRLDAVEGDGLDVESLPFSLKVLLENLLRTEDGEDITADDIRALAGWDAEADPDKEIQFTPARVIMQDFTGVPCVVDLATMREAMEDLGGDPSRINPLAPAEMVIDHSVIADVFGTPPRRSSATSRSSTSATASATSSCAGARAPSTTSRSSRPAPASCTRSTSSTSPAWCSPVRSTAS